MTGFAVDGPQAPTRHLLAGVNLARHLTGPSRVLDVAGGRGDDGVPLAELGHEVTILDPAGAMLADALAHAYTRGVTVLVVQATAEDAPDLFRAADFDVVLCHDLLHYAEDPVSLLRAATAPLRAGGLLSVIGPLVAAAEARDAIAALGAEVVARYRLPGHYHLVARV
ncbi:class I SAM-dependent methyltransferase [Actinokineospora auranticolor]|uniref:Methyltransferase family protein n=1 Tax=Actinokineospora auranticolor TaxID=155976 RepID=A0A2S6GHD1_9PSEU|nr:class I SAM-dependent methyltransferase [Actinokineospora auranticolor]PPK64615.1 methyltransferase family protein [Actinokineospora auranticolor]